LHYVIRTAAGRVERLASEDLLLGLGDHWHERSGSLAEGDMILLVSDGILDDWGDSLAALEDAIARCAMRTPHSAQDVVDCLCVGAIGVIDDDITAVALCRTR